MDRGEGVNREVDVTTHQHISKLETHSHISDCVSPVALSDIIYVIPANDELDISSIVSEMRADALDMRGRGNYGAARVLDKYIGRMSGEA